MSFTNAIYLIFLCLCVFCFFFLQVVTKWFFDDFWRPLMPFSTFLFSMLIVLWCSTPFTAVFFRMKNLGVFNAAARWRSCTCLKRISGHGRLEKHEILVMHTSLRNGAQILFRHKWRNLDTLLFFFIVLVNVVALLTGKSIIMCGSSLRL